MNEDQVRGSETGRPCAAGKGAAARPSAAQRAYLRRGLDEPGGKLPLFDRNGQRYSARTIQSCIDQGWAEPWFRNPIKPDWLICKLTEAGQAVASDLPETRPRRSRDQDLSGPDYDARRLQRLVREQVKA